MSKRKNRGGNVERTHHIRLSRRSFKTRRPCKKFVLIKIYIKFVRVLEFHGLRANGGGLGGGYCANHTFFFSTCHCAPRLETKRTINERPFSDYLHNTREIRSVRRKYYCTHVLISNNAHVRAVRRGTLLFEYDRSQQRIKRIQR